jgi:hypothetical protein
MNWILLGICTITGLTLTSCNSVGSGPSVDEPSVQQMNDLEHQWGLPDRKVHRINAGSADQPLAPEPAPAPAADPSAASQPAPAPAPANLDSEPPRLDAGTIKKLQ